MLVCTAVTKLIYEYLLLDLCKTVLTSPSSQKEMNDVLSISICWPARSYNWIMKWKKLDLRRFEGGCLVNSARPMPHLHQQFMLNCSANRRNEITGQPNCWSPGAALRQGTVDRTVERSRDQYSQDVDTAASGAARTDLL